MVDQGGITRRSAHTVQRIGGLAQPSTHSYSFADKFVQSLQFCPFSWGCGLTIHKLSGPLSWGYGLAVYKLTLQGYGSAVCGIGVWCAIFGEAMGPPFIN